MKRSLILTGILIIVLGILAACGGDDSSSDDKDTITVGTEGNYKPFTYQKENSDELTGYDVEVIREVGKRIDKEIKFVTSDFKSIFSSLETKRFDMIANQITITEERQENYDFSIPYTYSGAQVLVRADDTSIQGVEDLDGKKVGTTQGSNWADYAEEAGADVKFYGGIGEVLEDLSAGRIDAALNDRLFILTTLDETKYKEDVKLAGDTFQQTEMAFTFRKDEDSGLIEEINDALKEMKEDGTLADISEEWFGEDVSDR
jgi:cystine transport system substrate-binding protein